MSFNPLLDALCGVAYVTDYDGILLAYGEENWNDFARHNSPALRNPSSDYIGVSIFEAMAGESVRSGYRSMLRSLIAGERREVSFLYSCQAPETHRLAHMSIRRTAFSDLPRGLLFQSVTFVEFPQQRLPILDFNTQKSSSLTQGGPRASLCSFCQCVEISDDHGSGEKQWVHSNRYTRRPGSAGVLVDHTVCPHCRQAIVDENSCKQTIEPICEAVANTG